MDKIALVLLQLVLVFLGAPLLQGLIKKIKARLQARRGPSIFQTYFDLWKLLRKDSVVSEQASWVFRFCPYIVFAIMGTVSLFIPVYTSLSPLGLPGDAILVVYLFGLARFFTALAALDTGSAFGGMGSSREMTFAAFVEPALLMAVFAVGLQVNSMNLNNIVVELAESTQGYLSIPHVLAMIGFFIVLIAETGRVPVDNPATHLELTMVHEAMVLEYSGRKLALIEWSKAVKQFLFFALLANLVCPAETAGKYEVLGVPLSLLTFLAKITAISIVMAWVETLNAKLRLFRVPPLLGVSFCFSVLSMLFRIFVRENGV